MEKQFCKLPKRAIKASIFERKDFLKAFSLVELMISLIIISLVAAAFAPVITKKLNLSSIVIGSSKGFSEDCSKISSDCNFCAGDVCLSCKKTCNKGENLNSLACVCEDKVSNCASYKEDETCEECKDGYYLSNNECKKHTDIDNCKTYSKTQDKCTVCEDNYKLSGNSCVENNASCPDDYFVQIGNLCVTKYNMEDKSQLSSYDRRIATAGSDTCDSESEACCWDGITTTSCSGSYSNYSACYRTVCNYKAAYSICANFKYGGKSWRLPTTQEMETWKKVSTLKSDLMLCSDTGCSESSKCYGAYANYCTPSRIWSQEGSYYWLSGSTFSGPRSFLSKTAYSVRCVSELFSLIPHCETYQGSSCKTCSSGYYLQNGKCSKYTNVENCETYEANEDKCKTCASGYTLENNTCTTQDNCTDEYFIKIGNLCVARYNMGDSSETLIPSGASANVVSVGRTCVIDTDVEKVYKGTASKCCWKGNTAQDCDSTNGSYSGCNRTVCDYAAAKAICESFNKKGYSWRLPTTDELNINQLGNQILTINLGNSGLMLCDTDSRRGSSQCSAGGEKCMGATKNTCSPANIWLKAYSKFHQYSSGNTGYTVNPYYYYLENTYWRGPAVWNYVPKAAYSVRCVADMVSAY